MKKYNNSLGAAVLAAALIMVSCNKKAQDPADKTNEEAFEYIGGYPSQATIDKAYNELDVQRVSQVYLEFMPLASMQAFFNSHAQESNMQSGDVAVVPIPGKNLLNHIGLTYNTESIYSTGYFDLKKDGPLVLETPPNVLGVVNDGWMRYITDLGNAGPDRGQGGKYLIVHDDYDGEIPEGYFVFRTPTYRNWFMARAFQQNTGLGDDAINYYKKYLKVYPLDEGEAGVGNYIDYTIESPNTTHPRDESYLKLIHETLQYESIEAFTPYELGLLETIGIKKGEAFNPDKRLQEIYKRGIERGEAMAKANAYASRLEDVKVYDDREYEYLFVGGDYQFMRGPALNIDARTLFHYEAIVVTPAMAAKMVGIGSQYLAGYRDSNGEFLMGENTYKLHLPPGIPAKDFWSVTLYHPDTRSLLQNGTFKPSVNSYDEPVINEDGSVDLYFAPVAPEGKEKNWVKTLPGEGWTTLIRFYGPLEPYFDQTWRPDDIMKM